MRDGWGIPMVASSLKVLIRTNSAVGLACRDFIATMDDCLLCSARVQWGPSWENSEQRRFPSLSRAIYTYARDGPCDSHEAGRKRSHSREVASATVGSMFRA